MWTFQEQYNYVSSPAVSKRSLFFAYIRLLKVLKFEAAQNELNFPETNGASEFIIHMNTVIEILSSFQGKLKSAVLREKNDKDQLNRQADNERFNRYFVSKFYLLPSVD